MCTELMQNFYLTRLLRKISLTLQNAFTTLPCFCILFHILTNIYINGSTILARILPYRPIHNAQYTILSFMLLLFILHVKTGLTNYTYTATLLYPRVTNNFITTRAPSSDGSSCRSCWPACTCCTGASTASPRLTCIRCHSGSCTASRCTSGRCPTGASSCPSRAPSSPGCWQPW